MSIRVNRSLVIPNDELTLTFEPSGGPGGQHANKAATRAVLVWDVAGSHALGPRQRERVESRLSSRLRGGVLRLSSDRYRSQLRNREEVERRLAELVADALRPEKRRVATKPTRAAQEKRLESKRRRAETKRARRSPDSF